MKKIKLIIFPGYYVPHIGGLETHVDEFVKYLSVDENYDIGAFEFVGGITPSVPQNVTIQIINNTTARISWEASSNATQYIVEFSDLPDGTFTQAAVTTNTTVDIPIISTKKFYRVIATN
jgi:hypothetical protein